MIDLRPEDTIHKSYLNRILTEVTDNNTLSSSLAFKGGTCAAMFGFLDRFSVDLDFDLVSGIKEETVRKEFRKIFKYLDITIKKEFDNVLMFQVQYPSSPNKRNTIKVSVNSLKIKSNVYKVQYLPEINRLANCQTIETMFSNKLVAVTDRYKEHNTIAGRDIYDIHYFFINGYKYSEKVIEERTKMKADKYIEILHKFISQKVNQTIINEDLNALLPISKFQSVRKVLIPETLHFLALKSNSDKK